MVEKLDPAALDHGSPAKPGGQRSAAVTAVIAGVLLTIGPCAAVEVHGPFDVVDGDTIAVPVATGFAVIHLWGIDAPELGQPWGEEAQHRLEELVRDRVLEIDLDALRQGQATARVAAGGEDLSRMMLDSGLAWLADSDETSEEYARALIIARSGRRGQWSDDVASLTHPALWRDQHQSVPTPAAPTPTPIVNPLSRYASEAKLPSTDEGAVSIDRIPTKEIRQREERQLNQSLSHLASKRRQLEYSRQEEDRSCDQDDATAGDGGDGATYWSEEEQRWVSTAPVAVSAECGRARQRVGALLEEISRGKAEAVQRALWFGLSQSWVDQRVRAYGLDEY